VEIITCPACQKPLRLPPEFIGRRTRCPECRALFLGPVRDSAGVLGQPQLLRANPFRKAPLILPGVLLIFMGLANILVNAVALGEAYSDPEKHRQKHTEQFEARAASKDPEIIQRLESTLVWWPRIRILFVAFGVLTVLGGVAILLKKWHGLAMIGSVVSMFNVTPPLCCGSLPAGAIALMFLFNPDVRKQFLKQDPPPGAAGASS
jgi:hypothetical protein